MDFRAHGVGLLLVRDAAVILAAMALALGLGVGAVFGVIWLFS